jgi:hypothetical protein
MARDTEHSVRAVWRTLDEDLQRSVDDEVARGEAVSHPALGTVALWRALRLRRQWAAALVLTPLAMASTALGLLLGAGVEGATLLRTALSAPSLLLLAVTVGVPAHRLWVVRRAITRNCDVALAAPQLTDRTSRAASELSRHLAIRAAQARIQGGDSEA